MPSAACVRLPARARMSPPAPLGMRRLLFRRVVRPFWQANPPSSYPADHSRPESHADTNRHPIFLEIDDENPSPVEDSLCIHARFRHSFPAAATEISSRFPPMRLRKPTSLPAIPPMPTSRRSRTHPLPHRKARRIHLKPGATRRPRLLRLPISIPMNTLASTPTRAMTRPTSPTTALSPSPPPLILPRRCRITISRLAQATTTSGRQVTGTTQGRAITGSLASGSSRRMSVRFGHRATGATRTADMRSFMAIGDRTLGSTAGSTTDLDTSAWVIRAAIGTAADSITTAPSTT